MSISPIADNETDVIGHSQSVPVYLNEYEPMANTETGVIRRPQPVPVYLVGRMADIVLTANTERRFDSADEACKFIVESAFEPNRKSVIVQVIEVVESAMTLKPATQ